MKKFFRKMVRTAKSYCTKKILISLFKKYSVIFLGALFEAIGLQIFLVPNEIIDGGVIGISIMLSTITHLPLGLFLIGLNLPFLYLGYKHLGKKFIASTAIAILFLSICTAFFEPVPEITKDYFLVAIFGGILDGIGTGLIMRSSASADASEIVAIIVNKKTAFSVGEIIMFMNLFILSSAGFLFGWDKAMYSIVAYFVISKMIDVVLKGLDESYAIMIVTKHYQKVSDALLHKLGRGVTVLHGAGGYSGATREILYSVVTRLEVGHLKEVVLEEDPEAFITINAVHDLVGGRIKKRR